ncbi:hypothetical protein [Streptomyces sp. NBC_01190]|uniref:nSTAND1 domain-containing NTPase n=1 Tax=Streptomyces sp. NBC_01190 TaxID=2903767 RepID=UPI00386679BC|nr:hypothetical protein OG519_33920 [Streptomyces sp. NBC_01190]
MGRPESPLDAGAGPVQEFAAGLRELRARAGSPTYREMARMTGCGTSTLSQAAGGERMASLSTVLAFVQACAGNAAEWERRYRNAVEQDGAVRRGREAGTESPYRGLARFEPAHRELFFGRDDLVGQAVDLVGRHRFSALVGASGSGKSSLLRAGLIPALREHGEGAPHLAGVRIVTPGARPADAHAARLSATSRRGDILVVVDQFEEVFTLCRDSDERERFLGMLLNALDAGSGLRVVIGVRADFYGHCAQHPGLAAALRDAGLLVGPMNAAELREAVVKPAAAAGLIVERDLTARIIAEVGREPGSLPLMSHALLETWRRRHGRALTEAMYEAAGGLHGAIAATAEAFYASLSPSQTAAARRILLRLINPGEGAQDTRRSADRAELDSCDGSDTATVVEALATARLLTLDGDTVDLAHEALISGWPRYRLWIEEDREHLKIHRRLTEAARTWEEHRRDPGALYRGTRLSAACDAFAGADREGLTGLESAFLDTSRAARDHEIHVAARAARRLRALIAALSVMLVLAVTAGLIAAAQSRASERSRRRAVAAQQVALSRQLAAASSSLIGKNDDAVMLLAAQAYRTSPTEEARTALTAADALPMRRTFAGSVSPVTSMAFSHDGRTLIWGKDDRTLLRADTTDDRSPSLLAAPPDAVTSMALGPDERTLVTTDESRVVHELDLATGESLAPARFDSRITSQWLAPDGRTIVETRPRGPAASPGRIPTVTVRDIVSGKAHTTDLTGAGQPSGTGDVTVLGLSPDHRVLATMENPEVITLRDAASGHLRLRLDSRGFAFTPSTPVVFSPDGRLLAASGDDGNVRLWNTVTGDVSRVLDATSALTAAATSTDNADRVGDPTQVTALAFSPDGNTLAGGVGDGTIWLWDTLTNYSGIALTGYSSSVTELAFTPDSRTLASGAADGTVRLWASGGETPQSSFAPVTARYGSTTALVFSQNGRTLAVGAGDGGLVLRDVATGQWRTVLREDPDRMPAIKAAFGASRYLLAFGDLHGTVRLQDSTGLPRVIAADQDVWDLSADGRTLLTSDLTTLRLWDTATGHLRAALRFTTRSDFADDAALSPDGRTLAVHTLSGKIRIIQAAGNHLRTVSVFTVPVARAYGVMELSPDGRTLATIADDHRVLLWDTSTGRLRTVLPGAGATTVVFSPDSRTVAVGQENGARIWETNTGKARQTIHYAGLTPAPQALAFSPDGRTLALLDPTGRTVAWKIIPPDLTSLPNRLCAAVGRNLTREAHDIYIPGTPAQPVCPVPGRTHRQ